MSVSLNEVNVGDTIVVRGGWGREPAVEATVDGLIENAGHGLPGIDYTEKSTGRTRWAYLDQIVEIVTY